MKLAAPGLDDTAQEQDNGPHMPTQWTLVTSPARKAAALVSMDCMGAIGQRNLRRRVFDGERDEKDPPGHKTDEGDGHEDPWAARDTFRDHGS
jgi:hypothetical protein